MDSGRLKTSVKLLAAALLITALTLAPLWAMRFSHKSHQDEKITECLTCHKPGAFSIIPEQKVCLPCHEEDELADTPLGPTKTHTPLWVLEHGADSAKPDARCTSCHQYSFCVDCHQGGELNLDLTRRTLRTESVPRSHTSRFRIIHPLKATPGQIKTCFKCHEESFCSDCHDYYRNRFPDRLKVDSHRKSWSMIEAGSGGPLHEQFTLDQCQDCHPDGATSSRVWSSDHAREARRSLKTCQACHPAGSACKACHSAKSGLMVSPHPSNWRQIMSKFRKESPETCRECHYAGTF